MEKLEQGHRPAKVTTGANQGRAQQHHHHYQGHVYLWGEYGPGFPWEARTDAQQEQAMPVGPMNASDVDAFLGRKERILGLQRDPFNLKKILRTKIGKIKKKIRALTTANTMSQAVETTQVQQQQQPEADHDSKPAQPQQQQQQQQQQEHGTEPAQPQQQRPHGAMPSHSERVAVAIATDLSFNPLSFSAAMTSNLFSGLRAVLSKANLERTKQTAPELFGAATIGAW